MRAAISSETELTWSLTDSSRRRRSTRLRSNRMPCTAWSVSTSRVVAGVT